MAGTPSARTVPTRQMRHAAMRTPAVKVPTASIVNAASALASAFIIRLTSATNKRRIATSTAPQCSACVQIRCKRCSRFSASRHREMTQMSPMKGARTIQYVVMGVLEKLVYATPKIARISSRRYGHSLTRKARGLNRQAPRAGLSGCRSTIVQSPVRFCHLTDKLRQARDVRFEEQSGRSRACGLGAWVEFDPLRHEWGDARPWSAIWSKTNSCASFVAMHESAYGTSRK